MGGVNWWGLTLLVTTALLLLAVVTNTVRNFRQYRRELRAAVVPPLSSLRPVWVESDLPLAYLKTQDRIDELAEHADPYVRFVGRVAKVRSQAALEQGKTSVFEDRTVRYHFAFALQDLSESVDSRSKTAVYQSLLNLCMAVGFGDDYKRVDLAAMQPLSELDEQLLLDLRFCAAHLADGEYFAAYERIMEWSDASLMKQLYPGFLLCLSLLRDRIVVGSASPSDIRVPAEVQRQGFEALAALVDQAVSCLEAGNYARLVDLLVSDQERLLVPG